MSLIASYEAWLQEYRKDKYNIWIRAILSNGTEYYLTNYKDWFEIKKICESQKLNVDKIGLQYRSHSIEVDTTQCDGVYLIKSLVGVMGENTRHSFTIGKIYGDKVKKHVWITPELIEDSSNEDSIEECFVEGLIYHNVKSTRII